MASEPRLDDADDAGPRQENPQPGTAADTVDARSSRDNDATYDTQANNRERWGGTANHESPAGTGPLAAENSPENQAPTDDAENLVAEGDPPPTSEPVVTGRIEGVGVPATLEALSVPIDSIRAYSRNPRRGNVDAIKRSLRRHGQYRPIVVNARTGEVLAGNHTRQAALELGWQEIAATFVDVDDDAAARIVLVDNRASDLATNDDELLAQLLGELDGLDGTGYADDDLAQLLGKLSVGGDIPADTSPQLGATEYRLLVLCRDEDEQAVWLARLQEEGLEVQALAQ